jgi:hypothetical protein
VSENMSDKVPKGTAAFAAGLTLVATILDGISFIAATNGAAAIVWWTMATALVARLTAGVLVALQTCR